MDMQMPVMDGYEATRTIRATETPDSTCKIVALTASVFDKQHSAILELGCDDFVSKPLREELIFDKIAEHLGVTYIYADSDQQIHQQVSSLNQEVSDRELIATELADLEPEWLLNLHLAVRGADEEAIFRLLAQIQTTHPTIANVIQDLVDNFQLEQILSLIQPSIDNSSNGN
jgi:CheY-like chemotaxis protein